MSNLPEQLEIKVDGPSGNVTFSQRKSRLDIRPQEIVVPIHAILVIAAQLMLAQFGNGIVASGAVPGVPANGKSGISGNANSRK